MTAAAADFAHEPHDGHATTDAVRVDALFISQGWNLFRAIHDYSEPFLRIFKDGEVFKDALELVCEEHVKSVIVD